MTSVRTTEALLYFWYKEMFQYNVTEPNETFNRHQTSRSTDHIPYGSIVYRPDRGNMDLFQTIIWVELKYITTLHTHHFLEYEELFDNVNQRKSWSPLRHYGVLQKIAIMIRNPYNKIHCKIVHGEQLKDSLQLKPSKTRLLTHALSFSSHE